LKTNPLSNVQPWDFVSSGYTEVTMPMFEPWTKDCITRLNPSKADSVIDIACGPGTVSLMISPLVKFVYALDFSPKMIDCFNASILKHSISNVQSQVCDCQILPFENNYFDIAISQFGLMFFPDRLQGFREMHRVLRSGGKAAVYSWAPFELSPLMQTFFGAFQEGFANVLPPQEESMKSEPDLSDINTFKSEMEQSGFQNIIIEPIAHAYHVEEVETFWDQMVKGSAPLILMQKSISSQVWQECNILAKKHLHANIQTPMDLHTTAYLAIGAK
jgi:ubiquinone/menaquinone biosynthesis C-methylase UbiE